METNKLVNFSKVDIMEALEDFYEKKTGSKIDLHFDERNSRFFNLKDITVIVDLEGRAEIAHAPQLGARIEGPLEMAESDTVSTKSYSGNIGRIQLKSKNDEMPF